MEEATKEAHPKERLTREAWLSKALEVLGREGEGKLRIDSITRALGVTKGSFYWHFESREEFLHALLDYWDEEFTRRVQRAAERTGGTAEDKLRFVLEIVTNEDLSAYDHAFDAWAAHEPGIAERVRKVYAFRYQYIRSLFHDLNFRGNQLELRTGAFIGLMKFESMARTDVSSSRKTRRTATELEFFTRPL